MDVLKLVQGAGKGQPAWLQPWFNFWISSVTSAPAAYHYEIGLIELVPGFALVIGLLTLLTKEWVRFIGLGSRIDSTYGNPLLLR